MIRHFQFGDKTVSCRNTDESTIASHVCACCGPESGQIFIAVSCDSDRPKGRAFYAAYTPAQAREIAGVLIELANEIDARAGVQ